VTCTAVALLAAPAGASAATFCVHAPAGCIGVGKAKLQDALDAAVANGGGRDTIRLGQGLFNDGPAVNVAGSPVDIIGIALNKTTITSSSNSSGLIILDIQEPTSTISDLRVHHSTGAAPATGIKLAGDAENILVTNQGLIGPFDGISMVSTASLDESGVDLVYPNNVQNRAIFVPGGANVTIRHSFLRGVVGVFASGSHVGMQWARIHATQGVAAVSGATVQVSDSSILVPGPFDSNFQSAALSSQGSGTTTLNVDRVTAFDTKAAAFGVWVAPNSGAGNNAAVDLQGSVLSGFATDLLLTEPVGSSAAVSTSWSAYRDGSVSTSGSPTITEAPNNLDLTGVDPGFLGAGPGADLRLAHDSPLIDAGDPAFPSLPAPYFDVRGLARKRDGDGVGGAVVDIGAYEYQRAAPTVAAAFTPPAPMIGENVTLGGTGEDVDGEPLTYQWAFDDGGNASGPVVAHPFTTPGDHAATVTVTDPAGLTGSATATVPVQASPGGDLAPVLSRFRLVPSRFRVARRPRATARRRGGTQIRFRLSESARVKLTVQRRRRGHWVRSGRFAVQGKAGANRRRWSGRLRRKALRPGRYRMLATATDTAGQKSARARARFRIRRR
jgi:hypothetical protein